MPMSGGPGQQAIPSPMRAMPATRATGTATPRQFLTEQQPPNERRNNHQRQSGRGLADRGERQHLLHRIPHLMADQSIENGRMRLRLRIRFRLWLQFERQFVDLARELERGIVAILQERDAGAGVLADIEGLILRERDWRSVFN